MILCSAASICRMPRRANPTAHRTRASNAPTRVQVVPTSGGWQVRSDGPTKPNGAYATQGEAVRAAAVALQSSGGELEVLGENGRSTQTYTLGGAAMAKLAAVEGITFTPEMKRKIKAAQDPALSPEERRKILAGGFGKTRR
jgi:hypothetical protein